MERGALALSRRRSRAGRTAGPAAREVDDRTIVLLPLVEYGWDQNHRRISSQGRKRMFNRRHFLLGSAASLATPFIARYAAAEEVTLKLHHFLGPRAPAQTKMLEPWAQAIAKNSNGRVKIEIYPSMSLGGSPPQLFGQVRDGI